MNPQEQPRKSTFWPAVREWTQTIIIAFIIAIPIRYFIAEPFIVKGASMDPTFYSGQFLIVDRLTYRFEPPERNDVIVFEYPIDPRTYYIKRIIGLPGDKISMTDGVVVINGQEKKEQFIDSAHISHDTMSEITLGPTQYFMMGDNRAQSFDSRSWGAVDRKYLIGRPIIRLFPINRISVLPGKIDQ